MDFHVFPTLYQTMKKADPTTGSPSDYYSKALAASYGTGQVITISQLEAERAWGKAKKPYYNIYPSILPMLTKLNLDIRSSLISLPMDTLCIRLPKSLTTKTLSFSFQGEQYAVRSILVSKANVLRERGLTLWIDIGEVSRLPNPYGGTFEIPFLTYRNFRCAEGNTVEEDLQVLPVEEESRIGVLIPTEIEHNCVRLCCSLCLMQHDPDIVSPDVLSKDLTKYEETLDPKYIEKAHRRGKVGWRVGASIETIPHVRRPHPAIVWTGKGRKIPRIVLRKGSIVHRSVVEKLPTGFENPSNEEDHG